MALSTKGIFAKCTAVSVLLSLNLCGVLNGDDDVEDPYQLECFPNSSFTLKNPNPSLYLEVYARTQNSLDGCTSTLSDDGDVVFVDGCEVLDNKIEVIFTEATVVVEEDTILGGRHGYTVLVVKCVQIGVNGVNTSVEIGFTASTRVSRLTLPPGDTILTSYLLVEQAPGVSIDVTIAALGDELTWKIEGTGEPLLLPEKCIAYAGSNTRSEIQVPIITDGCSDRTNLLTDFSAQEDGLERYITSTLYVFQFPNSLYVTLWCSVRICSQSDESCNIDCSGPQKRSAQRPEDRHTTVAKTLRISTESASSAVFLSAKTDLPLAMFLIYLSTAFHLLS